MAKDHYRIPVSIDRSFLDHEIVISGGGWRIPPMPIKQLLFYGGSVLVLFWLLSNSWLRQAGWALDIVVVIWWLAATVFFGSLTRTNEMRFRSLPAVLAYLPRRARNVLTRSTSNPGDFYSIVGIDSISDNGLIAFSDGTFGQGYTVVGSASILLFDEDRSAILDRVDSYWRKSELHCEHIFLTTKESQRIYHQVANLERRNQALEHRDPDLVELMNEQYDILTEWVGGKFQSIHQYLILKGDTRDALKRGHNILQAEIAGSPLMIKECVLLDRDEVQRVLRSCFAGDDIDPMRAPTPRR